MKRYDLSDCNLLTFPTIRSDSGILSVADPEADFPFPIKRTYYIYDVPAESERGGHAHRELHQVLIAVTGSFEVLLNDGVNCQSILLNRSRQGLYLKPGIWRELREFTSGSVCIVLASEVYQESDYIRDYHQFLEFRTAT